MALHAARVQRPPLHRKNCRHQPGLKRFVASQAGQPGSCSAKQLCDALATASKLFAPGMHQSLELGRSLCKLGIAARSIGAARAASAEARSSATPTRLFGADSMGLVPANFMGSTWAWDNPWEARARFSGKKRGKLFRERHDRPSSAENGKQQGARGRRHRAHSSATLTVPESSAPLQYTISADRRSPSSA